MQSGHISEKENHKVLLLKYTLTCDHFVEICIKGLIVPKEIFMQLSKLIKNSLCLTNRKVFFNFVR